MFPESIACWQSCTCMAVGNTLTHVVQVEAYAALGKHREADMALQAAARRDPFFRETKEYKSLNTQLSAYVQKVPRR